MTVTGRNLASLNHMGACYEKQTSASDCQTGGRVQSLRGSVHAITIPQQDTQASQKLADLHPCRASPVLNNQNKMNGDTAKAHCSFDRAFTCSYFNLNLN